MSTPAEFRRLCREKRHTAPTSGVCPGFVQANLVVLPSEFALDFVRLCELNPKECPLLAYTRPGEYHRLIQPNYITEGDFDVRHDFPRYATYEGGAVEHPTDIGGLWKEDHVAFLIGCLFLFEAALAAAGLPARNWSEGRNVLMYRSTRTLVSSGVFVGVPCVVSMRPYRRCDIERVYEITGRFSDTHGAPLDYGYDAVGRLGLGDLGRPDYGDATEIRPDEVPVFWGCGVSAQVAALAVADQIRGPVMGHAPGHMLVTDVEVGPFRGLTVAGHGNGSE